MKKLRLHPDTLAVETFHTEKGQTAHRGTVHAHETELCGDTPNGVCVPYTTACYPSEDRTWCVCESHWVCQTD